MTYSEAIQVSIKDLLAVRGFYPIHETADSWIYFSPFLQEKQPTFNVFKATNTYKDIHITTEEGNTVNLICDLLGIDIPNAIQIILTSGLQPKKTLPENTKENNWKDELKNCKIRNLREQRLINYLQLEYNISPIIWKNQSNLFEFHFIGNDIEGEPIRYTHLAWMTDINSFELRDTHNFAKTIGPKHITTIFGETSDLNVFNDFIDYLSALQHFNLTKFKNTTIVLNCLSNINKVMPLFGYAELINLFLPNTKSGIALTKKLKANALPKQGIINRSIEIHPDYENFNDFLLKKPIKKGLS